MLLSYLKLAFRLFLRDPLFTLIKVFGLAVGFAVFFMIWPYATTELKTDQFHNGFERIVRIGTKMQWTNDGTNWGTIVFGAIGPRQFSLMVNDLPEAETFTRLIQQPVFDRTIVGHGSQINVSVRLNAKSKVLFRETRIIYADPNLFEFFNFPLLRGSSESVLDKANSIVLSESTAKRYFGDRNPLGEMLIVNDSTLLLVTGVYKDLPDNTHLEFDMVISDVGFEKKWLNDGIWALGAFYLRLNYADQVTNIEEKINRNKKTYFAQWTDGQHYTRYECIVQSLDEIAFDTPYTYDFLIKTKSKSTLILLKGVSVVILLMALINYIGLTLSRMPKRMKELAARKMSGAVPMNFAHQFVAESAVLNILGIGIAFTLIQLVREPADYFLNIHIGEFSSFTPSIWLIFILVCLGGILVTGLYPAFISMSHNPIQLFSGAKRSKKRGFPSLLAIGQYTSAIVLILWAFMVSIQLDFILRKNLGIKREQVVIVDAPLTRPTTYLSDFNSFLNTLHSSVGVVDVSRSNSAIGYEEINLFDVKNKQQPHYIGMDTNGGVDESFIPFYGIEILAGHNFVSSDKNKLIVSQYAAQRLEFKNPEEAVGQNIDVSNVSKGTMQIVGVIKDYRLRPLINLATSDTENSSGRGIILAYQNCDFCGFTPERIALRLDSRNLDESINAIKDKFDKAFPGNYFHWYFLDDHINQAYDQEKIARNQIILFTSLAIFISCLGLLGMMTTLAAEKMKEIGIRKVMGARLHQIGALLLRTTLRQVVVAHWYPFGLLPQSTISGEIRGTHHASMVAFYIAFGDSCNYSFCLHYFCALESSEKQPGGGAEV